MPIAFSSFHRAVLKPILWLLLAVYFLFAVALLALRYLVLPTIDDHRPAIEQLIGESIGAPVRIGKIAADWRGLHPQFQLSAVQVLDSQGREALGLPEVSAILSWRSLVVLEPRLLRLQLEAPALDVRRDTLGRYEVAGLIFDPRSESGTQTGLRWLLAQREISIHGAVLRWTDEQRGAPPLEVRDLSLTLQNFGRHHRAALRAQPPAALSSPLDIRAEFRHRLFSLRPDDMQQWQGTVYAQMDRVDLAAWRTWVDLPIEIDQGRGALRSWWDIQNGNLRGVNADLALDDVRLRVQAGLPEMALERVQGHLEATRNDGGHRITVRDLAVQTGDGQILQPGQLTHNWTHATAQRAARGEFEAKGLDLAPLAYLADRLPMPDTVRRTMAELQPSGRFSRLDLAWEGAIDTPAKVSINGQFVGLSVAAAPLPVVNDGTHPQRPGFSNLSGSIVGTSDGALLSVDATDATLSFPGVFEAPDVALKRLTGQADLRRDASGRLHVGIERVAFEHEAVKGEFKGSWSSEGSSPAGTLDMTGRLLQADVREVHRFMPLVVDAEVRTWLRHALVSGKGENLEFKVRGDLDLFPFSKEKQGEFHVGGKVRDVTLDYAPASISDGEFWPRLEALNGDLSFDRVSMAIATRNGRVRIARDSTVNLGPTRARIANLEDDSLLEVKGEARGQAAAFLAFVKASPVGELIGGVLDQATASGDFVVPLSLSIPLAHSADTQVSGEVRLAGNDFRLEPGLPGFSRLGGRIGFSNDGLAMHDVNGMLLDGPVRVSGGPQANGDNRLQFDGTADVGTLSQWWPAPGMARIKGRAAYQASVLIKSGELASAQLESDMIGVALDFPAPLAKTAQETRPLRLEWGPVSANKGGPSSAEWLSGGLGDHVNLYFERDRDAASGQAGALRGAVGVNRAATILGDGLGLNIELPEVDVDVWRGIQAEFEPARAHASVGAPQTSPAPLGFALQLGRVNLSTGRLLVRGRHLDQVKLYAVREQGSGGDDWRADIESEQLAGKLAWSEPKDGRGANRLTARLTRLIVKDEPGSAVGEADIPEDVDEDVPEIDLQADRFDLFGKSLGRLQVLAQSTNRGREWHLRRLNVKNPDAELEGSGVWKVAPEASPSVRRVMTLDAVLKLADTGKFLERMGSPGTMAGGSGQLSAKVSWRGSPYSLDLPSLSGQLELTLDKGQFLKADPGIAKLLGVLSLQTLPRRVTLDFRDVFSDGFAYDTIRAHAGITDGVAHTDDFKMNGVSATVVIAGDTDLVRETQKLQVLVVPKLDAGGASLLYGLAVNPAIGLSVFLAQLLLKDPLSKVLSYQYAISGSWEDPQVNRVSGAPNEQPGAAPNSSEPVNTDLAPGFK